jgi:hypothetical protein
MSAPKWTDFTETMYYKQAAQMGKAKLALRQLAIQCGDLSIAQQDKVRSISAEQLERLIIALLRFRGMEDLERWLGENVG